MGPKTKHISLYVLAKINNQSEVYEVRMSTSANGEIY